MYMTTDVETLGTEIHDSLNGESQSALRSIVAYKPTDYSVIYMRDDVEMKYSASEIETAVEQLRFQSLEEAYLNEVFAGVHGEFECHIDVFTRAAEFNFVVADGTGVEVAFDTDVLAANDDLVTKLRDLIVSHSQSE